MQTIDLPAHLAKVGNQLRDGLDESAKKHEVPMTLSGHPALTSIGFDHPDALALQTLLTHRMLDHGILAGASFYASLAHTEQHVQQYLAAADNTFCELAQAIREGDAMKRIGGNVRHSGFQRLA